MSWKRANVQERMRTFVADLEVVGYALDIGSGDGIFTKLLLEKNIITYQIDSTRHSQLVSQYILGDVRKLPIRPKSCELLFCGQVLHYIESVSLYQTLDKLLNKLILGGKLAIVEYLISRSYSWIPYPIHKQTLEEFAALKEGFSIEIKKDHDNTRPKFRALISKN